MNERIQDLMAQANRFAEENYNTLAAPYRSWSEIQGEKFAELIVRGCVEVANNHFESKEPGYPGDKIKEHFGVEE